MIIKGYKAFNNHGPAGFYISLTDIHFWVV